MHGNLCETEETPCLYNLTADPCEHRNLASEQPQLVKELKAKLSSFAAETILTWKNFENRDPKSAPTNHGPTVPISPDPQV